MADSHLTSGDRLRIYQALFLLNRHFHLITCRLSDLDTIRIFPAQRLRELRGLTRELQTEVNHGLLNTLSGIEDIDWFHFGRVRIAKDHRLNPDRPAFTPHQ